MLPDSKDTELGSSNQEASPSGGKNTRVVLVPCSCMEVRPYSYFWSHNSLKLCFTNICGLRSNFADCEFFLESNSPDILALCETNLDDSIDSGNFSKRGF